MFITIENYSIPICSIVFIERVMMYVPDEEEETEQYEIHLVGGKVLYFKESKETEILEEIIKNKTKE